MRFKLTNGLSMGYRSSGMGRVLVLLHPIGTCAEFWAPLVAELRNEFRCLSVDLRGCGESDSPPSRFTLADLAEDVTHMLRCQGISEPVIIGCSMGGMVAQAAVLESPALFSGLVLAGTVHAQTVESRRIALQRASDSLAGMPAVVEDTLRRWFPAPFHASDATTVERVRHWLLDLDPITFSWGWAAIADVDFGERLRQIDIPALLARGDKDHSGRLMPEMARMMRRGHFEEMPGAGHFAPLERPREFATLVRNFIRAEIDTPGS